MKTPSYGFAVSDGGREEFHVKTGDTEIEVSEEDYEAAAWVSDLDEGDDFGEVFTRELEDYVEAKSGREVARKTVTYSAAAGNLIRDQYSREEWNVVEEMFKDASTELSAREGGVAKSLSKFAGLFSPSGHGFMNPYHEDIGVCRGTIVTAAKNGFILRDSGRRPPSFYAGNEIKCEQCVEILED